MTGRASKRLAWALLGVGVALTAATLLMGISRGRDGPGLQHLVDDLHWFLSFVLFIPVGALMRSSWPRVTTQLEEVVQDTMQPRHVSLWLRSETTA